MTVYLIHLERPYHHARHYLGYTSDLAHRLMQHRNGAGAKLLKAVTKAGIPFEVVRTWEGYADLEKQLKAQKNAPRYCPVCIQQRIAHELHLQQHRFVETSSPGLWSEVSA
jgi:predicted GIY-YIG superfamily endonuclease